MSLRKNILLINLKIHSAYNKFFDEKTYTFEAYVATDIILYLKGIHPKFAKYMTQILSGESEEAFSILDGNLKEISEDMLEIKKFKESLVSSSLSLKNSQVIEPCYIGDGVELVNSVVGPHVSIVQGTKIENSRIENSVIQEGCIIKNQNFSNTMLGNAVQLYAELVSLSLSDYSTQGI